MDLYAQQAAFKAAVFAAEQQLKPVGWSMEFHPIVVKRPDTDEIYWHPFGMTLKRGRQELVVALTQMRSPWMRSLN